MTYEDLKTYFTNLCAAENIQMDDLDTYVKIAIELGLSDFWGAADWHWKEKQTTMSITSGTYEFALPDDFGRARSFRERASSGGLRLRYMTKEDFDNLIAKPSAHSTGKPEFYTIYRDEDTRDYKIAFYPPSESLTLYMSYQQDCGRAIDQEIDAIPGEFKGGLEKAIAVRVYPRGNRGRAVAMQEYMAELARLLNRDTVTTGRLTEIPDETTTSTEFVRWWTVT